MANTQSLGHQDLSQHEAGQIDLLDNAPWCEEDVFRHHQQSRKPTAAFKAGRLLTPSRATPTCAHTLVFVLI